MNIRNRAAFGLGLMSLGVLAGSLALAQPAKEKPGAVTQPEMPLPPGWTQEDLQACLAAGATGPQHSELAKQVGVWNGRTEMWMGPGMPSAQSECTNTITSVMDGRFVKCELAGEMPGMGQFNGIGFVGFDNVSQKYVATWIDNHNSGIMQGEGQLSKDGRTMTWSYMYNCPITKKPTTMRQVETYPDSDTSIMDVYMTDPKSGKEYKSMHVDFKRSKK